MISFYDFKKLAENINTKLWNHFQECEITVSDDIPDVLLRKMKAEIMDYGLNISHEGEESETYLENDKSNENSEPECYQDDNTTDFRHSIKGESDVLSDFDDFNQAQEVQCKSNITSKTYTCNICSEHFKKRYEFMRHLVTHAEGANISPNDQNHIEHFKCDVCSAVFQSINSLSAHKKKHVNKDRILSCSVCKKIFKKISHLKRHEMCHEVNRPHKCLICSKSFKTERILNDHVNAHNGVKPYVCPLCSKSFSHLSTLNSHIKIHMCSKKKYLCPTCGKKFDSSSNLNQHVLRHAGLKMFACSLCPRKFVSKGNLMVDYYNFRISFV